MTRTTEIQTLREDEGNFMSGVFQFPHYLNHTCSIIMYHGLCSRSLKEYAVQITEQNNHLMI